MSLAPARSSRQALVLPVQFRSIYPVTGVFLDDIRIHGLGIGDIEIALRNRAVALLGKAAPVERGSQSRIDLESGVEIGDRVLGLPVLQVEQSPAVQRIDKARAQPQRLVAILQRRLQVADHG